MLGDLCPVQCGRKVAAGCKGLCMACYSAAKKRVEKGEVTWEELAEMGLGEKEQNPFDKALAERKANNAGTK